MKVIKNMESAQHYGQMFGQDVEPSGTYVLEKDFDHPVSAPWVEGTAELKKPLYIEVNDENSISYKRDLALQYKAKGKALTNKLMAKGYDSLVTKYANGSTGEIVLFPNCRFMLNPTIQESKILIKRLLKESLLNKPMIDEDYPINFSLEEFSKITSFNDRIKYCEARLKRVGSGSARIVYVVDGTKALKIAKNRKGLAQNEVEISHSKYADLRGTVAEVFEYHQDDLWLEMELATKVTPAIFKQVSGFSFEDYCAAVHNHGNRDKNPSSRDYYTKDISPDIMELMWDDEFVSSIFQYIANYDLPVGDLQVLTSYGMVNRNGSPELVLVDYGLDSDVCASFYCKTR